MKKIMFLGGALQQVVAIEYAKKQGYYTVLCDYLKDNPGQYYADAFYCVSTTDKQTILELAKKLNINGIVAYASEPAASVAAYVGNQLNLPSNPYESVLILSNKNLFRDFLKNNGFNYPKAKSFELKSDARSSLQSFQFPVMVKPVDSSGSRGITFVDCIENFDFAFDSAISESRTKKVIIEEYIEMAHECIVGGDVIVVNGKIEYFGFLNGYRDIEKKLFIPFGNSYPVFLEEEKLNIIRQQLQVAINLLKINTSILNIEVMFDKNDKPYIIELAARNGGNMISQLLEIATGVDLVKVTVEAALNNRNLVIESIPKETYYSIYYLHSYKKGILKNINFNVEIQDNIIDSVINKKTGEEIEVFDGLNKTIGILFLRFDSLEELKNKMKNMEKYIEIQIVC